MTLLTAAYKSGENPDDYLTRLAPYAESKIAYDPRLVNAAGYVNLDNPDTAVITRSARELADIERTVPHELEHTLQKTRKDAPGFQEVSRFRNVSSDQTARRFGTWDERYDDLQERVDALPEEQKKSITGSHPVFGRYLGQGTELMARLRAQEMADSAQGKDFLQTEMGQALFPTDDDRAYFLGSTLPGVPSASPPYSFDRTDSAPTSVEDQKKSYARRLMDMLPK